MARSAKPKVRHRTMVQLPPDLVAAIDKYAGAGQRSAFIAELVRRELRRREQQEALRAAAGAWKDEDHPELAEGAAAYVRKMRQQDEKRFQRLLKTQGRA